MQDFYFLTIVGEVFQFLRVAHKGQEFFIEGLCTLLEDNEFLGVQELHALRDIVYLLRHGLVLLAL